MVFAKNTPRSTLAGIKLIDHVSKQMENYKTPGNLYIALSKAFDTLRFDILLYKLKYYGVTDTALELMGSYLKKIKNRLHNAMLAFPQEKMSHYTTG